MRGSVPGAAAAALACAAAGYLAGAARPAAAAPPPPDRAFECRVVLVDFDEFKDLDEYKALERELGTPWKAQFAFQERVLSRAGAEGFELAQVVVPKTPAQSIFYLRRAVK